MSQNTPTPIGFDPRVTALSRDPDLIKKLVEKTAPTLIGLDQIKLATLYHLVKAKHEKPINILLIGDPGTGKTSLLLWIKTIHNETKSNIEPNYIQVENINRLSTQLQRELEETENNASLIATSRPFLGRYNPYRTITQNIHLPNGLLKLFDLVLIIRDHPDHVKDQQISEKLLDQSKDSESPIDELFARYLKAARSLNPLLSDEAKTVLQEYYLAIRSQSSENEAITITPWQLVSLRKLAEARAKLHLREHVSSDDAEAAVRMLNYSLEMIGIDPVSRRSDIDAYYTGRPTVLNSKLLHVAEVFLELEKVSSSVKRVDLESTLWERYGMTQRTVGYFLRSLIEEGFILEISSGCFKRKEWGTDDY